MSLYTRGGFPVWWGKIRRDRSEGSLHTRFLRKLVKRIYCILINPSFIHLECLHGNRIFVSRRWAFRLWKVHSVPYKPSIFPRTTSLKFSMHRQRLPNPVCVTDASATIILSMTRYNWLLNNFSVPTQISVLPLFIKNIKHF